MVWTRFEADENRSHPFFLASLYLFFLIFRDEVPYRYILATLALVGFNPFFWDYKDHINSDLPFMFFSYLSIYIIHRKYEPSQQNTPKVMSALVIGLFLYLAYGTRSIGITLIPSLLLYDLIRNHRITSLTFIAISAFIYFILLQNLFLHGDNSYISHLGIQKSVKSIQTNSVNYIISVYYFIVNDIQTVISYLIFSICSALSLLGIISRMHDRFGMVEIFSLIYLGVVLAWPYWEGLRFLLPLIPFWFLSLFLGMSIIDFSSRKLISHYTYIGFILMMCVLYALQYAKMDFSQIRNGIAKKESVELFDYIKRATQEQDVFIFLKPRALALFTARKAAPVYRTHDEAVWKYFRQIQATYLIIGPPGPLVGRSRMRDIAASLWPSESVVYVGHLEFLRQFVSRYQKHFQEVYANGDFQVYRIRLHDDEPTLFEVISPPPAWSP